MTRTMLKDEHWNKLVPILLDFGIYNKPNLRLVIEGILYRIRCGCPWRDIPEVFGKSNSIYRSFQRWSKNHKIINLFNTLSLDNDPEWLFMDASHVRVHQHGTGAVGTANQAIAKSAGGNTSKIHLIVDACGNPVRFMITDGVTHDVSVAPELINLLDLSQTEIVCADKGYDSENLRIQIENQKVKANIPKKKNSKSNNHHMDWHIYRYRHLVENAFAKLKQFRAVATRFDKLKSHYENTVALACLMIWIKL